MRFKYILICLIFILHCKQNPPIEQCEGSSTKATLVDREYQNRIDVDQPSNRIGGYLKVDFNKEFLQGRQSLVDHVAKASATERIFVQDEFLHLSISTSIYKNHYCTALFDFIDSDDGDLLVYLWTSRHCVPFPFVDSFALQISTPRGYVTVPFTTDFNLPNSTIGQLFNQDFDAFLPFLVFTKSTELRRSVAPVTNPTRTELREFHDYVEDIDLIQRGIFIRNMCNSFTEKNVQIRNFEVDKICFNLKDLLVMSGTIDLSSLVKEQKDYVIQLIRNGIIDRENFYKKTPTLVQKFTQWRNAIELLSLSSYFEKLSVSERYFSSRCSSEQIMDQETICSNATALEIFQKEYDRVADLLDFKIRSIKLPEYLGVEHAKNKNGSSQIDFHTIVREYIQPLWMDLMLSIDDTRNLFIHTNIHDEKSKTTSYQSLSYSSITSATDFPPLLQPLGIAHLLPKKIVNFSYSDSGSMLTVGGYYPLITLSTINDDEGSGGFSNSTAQDYQSNDDDILRQEKPDLSPTPPSHGSTETNSHAQQGSDIYSDQNVKSAEESLPSQPAIEQRAMCR